MAKLPEPAAVDSQVVRAIYEAHERNRKHWLRQYLGASEIGHDCERRLWYTYRNASKPEQFDGRMLRLFFTGDLAEKRIGAELSMIGCQVLLADPTTGKQWEFTGCKGHLVCHLDGAVIGVPEAPKTWHSLEIKTMNAKHFAVMQSRGIKVAKREHYEQCVVGMALSGLTRCLYIVVNKDTDELYSERLRWEECKSDWESIEAKCWRVITAAQPPARISDNPESRDCKYCPHKAVCHYGEDMQVTCRTCQFATVWKAEEKDGEGEEIDGNWWCSLHGYALSGEQQRAACADYRQLVQITLPVNGVATK